MASTDPSPASFGLLDGILESARRHPSRDALVVAGRTSSYAELIGTAGVWAGAIVEALPARPSRIAVFGSRTEVSYLGVLAALWGGAAFVPLSPALPPARTRAMLKLADPDAVVVDDAELPALRELSDGLEVPILPKSALEKGNPLPSPIPVDGTSPAYLLFTSGSTGAPKGVPISHRNVRAFLGAAARRYRLTPEDRLTQTFEQIFDLSVFDLFMAWDAGACVCSLQPIDLLSPFRFLRDHGITVWFSVPSVPALLRRGGLLRPGSLPTLRWSLFCGEALPRATAESWQAAAPDSVVENLYGPTEATIACTAYRWDPGRSPSACVDGLVPIGGPLDQVEVRILGEDGRPVGAGGSGELCVAGPQVFDGYWRDPRATERAFVTLDGARHYRTGDRVRDDGDLVFLGRGDEQVQVLGHRVELGEVEAAARDVPGVAEVAAVGIGDVAGTAERVEVFVTGDDISAAEVIEAARARLPSYAVPRSVRVLGSLPLTPNGKVDRAALRRLAAQPERLEG